MFCACCAQPQHMETMPGELGNGNAGNGCVKGAAADEMHPLSVMPTKAHVAQMLGDDLQRSVRLERTDMGTRKGAFPPFFCYPAVFFFRASPPDKTPTAPSWVSPFHKSFRMKKNRKSFWFEVVVVVGAVQVFPTLQARPPIGMPWRTYQDLIVSFPFLFCISSFFLLVL